MCCILTLKHDQNMICARRITVYIVLQFIFHKPSTVAPLINHWYDGEGIDSALHSNTVSEPSMIY